MQFMIVVFEKIVKVENLTLDSENTFYYYLSIKGLVLKNLNKHCRAVQLGFAVHI